MRSCSVGMMSDVLWLGRLAAAPATTAPATLTAWLPLTLTVSWSLSVVRRTPVVARELPRAHRTLGLRASLSSTAPTVAAIPAAGLAHREIGQVTRRARGLGLLFLPARERVARQRVATASRDHRQRRLLTLDRRLRFDGFVRCRCRGCGCRGRSGRHERGRSRRRCRRVPCLVVTSLPRRGHTRVAILVLGLAADAANLLDGIVEQGDDRVVCQPALARAVIVNDVTGPKPALFHSRFPRKVRRDSGQRGADAPGHPVGPG